MFRAMLAVVFCECRNVSAITDTTTSAPSTSSSAMPRSSTPTPTAGPGERRSPAAVTMFYCTIHHCPSRIEAVHTMVSVCFPL